MKLLKKLLCTALSLSVSGAILYADTIYSFPSELVMRQNDIHNSFLGLGVSIGNLPEEALIPTEAGTVIPIQKGTYEATLNIGSMPFKKVKINVTDRQKILASGELIGIKIFNKGLIVTNLAPVSSSGREVSPAQKAGILPGDIILKINGTVPKTSEDVCPLLTKNTELTVRRNNTLMTLFVIPALDDTDGLLKLGLWVRDSSAGVGTVTYLIPENSSYGALGHGISDSDTGIMFDVASGTIEKSSVVSVKKGAKGSPGQICGSFTQCDNPLGTIFKNCEVGLFGKISADSVLDGKPYPIGAMSQVKKGKATILSTVDGDIKEYKINILRALPYGSATKGLSIEITDPELLQKTGGIVQGMSGSPIIQNGKLIGAVTHVLVNDPTRGYGIFIENMLAEAEKIK